MSSYHSRRTQAPRSRREYVSEATSRLQQEEEERRIAQEKAIENNETNFPSLVTSLKAPTWSTGSKTFAQLASEWSEKAKEEELTKQVETEEEQRTIIRPRYNHALPKFHNVHRFVEPEDDEISDEQPVPVNQDDGWVTVQRKARREKTIEEKFNRPETPPQDSVWNADDQPNDHETCWDEKRY
jgi:hypothetical protein